MSMQLADITTKYRAGLVIAAYRQALKSGNRVLDVGCGNGIISDILQQEFDLKMTGCDIASYLARKIDFVRMVKKDKLPFKDKQFDVVLFTDALHHVEYEYQERLLQEALRVGKRILIFELKPTKITRICDWMINMIHYKEMQIPFTYRTPLQWEEMFRRLKIKSTRIDVAPPWWYPFAHQAFDLNKFDLAGRKSNHFKQ